MSFRMNFVSIAVEQERERSQDTNRTRITCIYSPGSDLNKEKAKRRKYMRTTVRQIERETTRRDENHRSHGTEFYEIYPQVFFFWAGRNISVEESI